MKRAKTHIILFMAVTTTVLYTVYIAFHNSTERVNTQIDHAFKSAITEDYNERLSYISYYHPEPTNWDIKMYTIAPSLHQKVKSYTIRTRQGKTIYTFKDSLDEQTAKRMLNQYILSQLKPIKPDELNATFRKILSDHDITGRTGTIYYNKSISQHSDQSSAIPRTAHNLSNINTEGYTRQQIAFRDTHYLRIGGSYASPSASVYGLGVGISEIRRIRDEFIDKAYRTENGRLGYYSNQYKAIEEVEDQFGELQDRKSVV